MILIASILGGTAIGYLNGAGRRGTDCLVVWLAVFAGQTALLLSVSDDIRNRDAGDGNSPTSRSHWPSSPWASLCCTPVPPSVVIARRSGEQS